MEETESVFKRGKHVNVKEHCNIEQYEIIVQKEKFLMKTFMLTKCKVLALKKCINMNWFPSPQPHEQQLPTMWSAYIVILTSLGGRPISDEEENGHHLS